MAQEREIATRIASLSELSDILSAIRAMAASQMQQALVSLEAIRSYSDIIREALVDSATLLPTAGASGPPQEASRSGLVVFCAEHGLCGGFNERLLEAAEKEAAGDSNRIALVVVGTRGGQLSRERRLHPVLTLPMATHCDGVTAAARRAAAELYRMFSRQEISGVEVVHAQQEGGQFSHIERHRLLPLEMLVAQQHRADSPPLINVPARRLFDDIAGEYFFATLENAAMQSFFSENAARFRTMEAAHQNIEKKSGDLTRLKRRLRQDAVTTEILDLISGAEALSSER